MFMEFFDRLKVSGDLNFGMIQVLPKVPERKPG